MNDDDDDEFAQDCETGGDGMDCGDTQEAIRRNAVRCLEKKEEGGKVGTAETVRPLVQVIRTPKLCMLWQKMFFMGPAASVSGSVGKCSAGWALGDINILSHCAAKGGRRGFIKWFFLQWHGVTIILPLATVGWQPVAISC